MTTAPRGRPLSMRLALLLSVAVIAVLLITGIAVNRLVSRSLEQELGAAQHDRLAFLAAELDGVDLSTQRARRIVGAALRRLANSVSGRVELVAADGSVVLAAGNLANAAAAQVLEEPIPGGGPAANLVLRVPSAERAFLRVFNLTLVVAGVVAVLVLLAAAALLSDRLTRPLRGVAAAARRLGAGDLATRAEGGPDRESAELADAFNAMASRLQSSEELRRRAASDMAHDLATPATVLESQLQAMLDGVVPADREQLERARAAAASLSGVVVQLRDLVDVEAAALQRRPESVAVATLMTEAASALQPLFRERGVRLEVEMGDGTHVEVDPAQVSRALRNVMTNAAQHAPAGSAVVLSAGHDGARQVLRVADRGPGIAPEDLPHVFERFYRADRSRGASAGGSGIGLTIARELARANGGDVWVELTGSSGTVFAIGLPVAARS
jgi:two-component system sensor histidine kinase BaeS